VRALVEELLKHWPGRWEDLSNPDAPHEASMLNLETSKAFHILGWAPRWSFEKTVAHAVKWYQACERAPENCRQVMHEQMAAYVGGQT
jgi:CDP-glucose 4,6-dehydratase